MEMVLSRFWSRHWCHPISKLGKQFRRFPHSSILTSNATSSDKNKYCDLDCSQQAKSMFHTRRLQVNDTGTFYDKTINMIRNQQKRHSSTLLLKHLLDSAPVSMQPYLRLIRFDKPIGTWLLYLPCLWSIGLSAPAGCLPDIKMLALFGAGAFLMRGAGCIINDLADKDFDKKVERTKMRPLASGELSQFQALTYLAGHLSLSLAILLQFNWYSVVLGTSSLALVVIYPFMKRYTYWPQAVLGLTFNWGALLGYAAVTGACEWPVVGPLYAAGLMWTLIYDTIYAHQDKEDDAIIGIKSTALKFGTDTKYWLASFTALMVPSLAVTGFMSDQTWPYYAGIAGVAAHLSRQIYTLNIDSPDDCAAKFRSNRNLGLYFFLAIVASTLLRSDNLDDTSKSAAGVQKKMSTADDGKPPS